ncbi:hypothetical protein BOX15_Mlig030149g1 [Macrostomum lignano]|uniref:Uncharacterized protein n=1 Tax=Macrostomum lignano TaxID=282301 RepID=A0A267DTP7_9PLAT|nr:hypothetical protein BOX15_Mlig030149g1 [Macrostomum lignano]
MSWELKSSALIILAMSAASLSESMIAADRAQNDRTTDDGEPANGEHEELAEDKKKKIGSLSPISSAAQSFWLIWHG